jgi:predicted nucleic acid-binding protein
VTRLLVDNSALQRIGRSVDVAAAFNAALDRGDELCSMVLTTLEAGFSARSAADHAVIVERLQSDFTPLVAGATAQALAIEFQSALWSAGSGRAAGAVDLLIAATAVEHDAVVLHYDSDFDELTAVDRRVRAQWVVPRGSVA